MILAGPLVAFAVVALAIPAIASAELASDPTSAAAGGIDAGRNHTCAVLSDGKVRCWGHSLEGALGYPGQIAIGDDESPSLAGPVDLGAGRTAVALAVGRLGFCAERSVGDDELPGSTGPVGLGDPAATAPACPPSPPGRAAVRGGQTAFPADPLQAESARRGAFMECRRRAGRHLRAEARRARRLRDGGGRRCDGTSAGIERWSGAGAQDGSGVFRGASRHCARAPARARAWS